MDITEALAPASDQLDAVELVVPRTFTIDTGSKIGTRDGRKVAEIRLVGFPRVWRPSKGMLDVLAACWGIDGKQWAGRSVTLYCDPDVKFGPDVVGGIRISHLSHIDEPRTIIIRANGVGRKRSWHVEPLPDAPAGLTPDQITACTDAEQLRTWWMAYPNLRDQITARGNELQAAPDGALIPPHEGDEP